MLARGGIRALRIVDFDQVTLSSLNRHACAVLADVGKPKAVCLAQHLKQICPDENYLYIDTRVEMYTSARGPGLLEDMSIAGVGHALDLVIDAIDDVPTKAALIVHCLERRIPVVSCMGAGGKSDVTRLHISDLKTASKDPLASKLRQELKRMMRNKAATNETTTNADKAAVPDSAQETANSLDDYLENMERLTIVYSSEKPVAGLADMPEGDDELGLVDGMRIRPMAVLGAVPATMGQALAAWSFCQLGNKPFQPVTGERVGRGVRHKMYQLLQRREDKITKDALSKSESVEYDRNDWRGVMVDEGTWVGPVQIDTDDVEYLMHIWRNRCAVTGARLGTVLELVRWDMSKPSHCDNLVLMSRQAITKYDGEGGKESIPESVRKVIESRLATCRVD
jgi:tRNA threonylcarbamoyladenosine dehydratase